MTRGEAGADTRAHSMSGTPPFPLTLRLSKGERRNNLPLMVREPHHERVETLVSRQNPLPSAWASTPVNPAKRKVTSSLPV
jgi:hypothetical protein